MQNATDLLIDYARDHRDRRNIASHFVGVPLVVFAVGALLARARFVFAGQELSMAWVGAALLATVYLAQDRKHRRQVAIKLLRPEPGRRRRRDGHGAGPQHVACSGGQLRRVARRSAHPPG